MIHVHVNKEIKFCRFYVYFLNCFQKIRSTCIHIHVHVFIWNNKTKYFTSTFELFLEILVRLKKHATYIWWYGPAVTKISNPQLKTLIRNVHTFEVKTQDLRLVTAGPDDQIIRRPDIVLMVLYIFIYR